MIYYFVLFKIIFIFIYSIIMSSIGLSMNNLINLNLCLQNLPQKLFSIPAILLSTSRHFPFFSEPLFL